MSGWKGGYCGVINVEAKTTTSASMLDMEKNVMVLQVTGTPTVIDLWSNVMKVNVSWEKGVPEYS